jgi:cyclophilin family peptidyl-prolyl cis-trans isomerase
MSRFNMAFIVAIFLLNSHLPDADAKTTKKGIPVTTTSTNPVVLIETNKGPIEIELWEDKAPITVKNFLTYVDENFYNNTIFHRVIPKFMIQGGGMTADMKEKSTHPPIKNEASKELLNKKGTLAMARTSDINSASSQFFINLVDNGFLDHTGTGPQTFGYAVFGAVTKGMETVEAIAKVTTGNSGYHQDVPQEAVIIKSARRK